MQLLDLTLTDPFSNVAMDEALLETAEAGRLSSPVLRLWEPVEPLVVLGRSSPLHSEVDLDACNVDGVSVIRRCSGGATILTAPGCLMYAVVLSYQQYPFLKMLDTAHQFVMEKIQKAILGLGIATQFKGTCDLTINNRKVSGNALRCKRNWMVYHGTLICQGMNLELISKYLGTPQRQPDYRQNRSHEEFIGFIPTTTKELKTALEKTWCCDSNLKRWPKELTLKLVDEKYSQEEWNKKI